MPLIDIDGGVPATTLNGAINSSVTSINVTSGTGWPTGAGGTFYAVIDRGLSTQEVVACSARSTNTLTVTRAADGSTAYAHDDTAPIEHIVPALALQEANSHANATTGTPHGTAYLTPTAHTAIEHATALIADAAVTDDKLAASGLDISKFTTGTSDRNTTGNAATATSATSATSATTATTATNLASTAPSTFTPTLTQGVGVSISGNASYYLQVGRIVDAWYYFTVTASGTAGQIITLSLPVTAGANDLLGGTFFWKRASPGGTRVGVARQVNTTTCGFVISETSGSALNQLGEDDTLANTGIFSAHIRYAAAS